MASRELQIVTTLKDNASQQLQGMQGKLKSMQPQFRKMAMAGTAAFAGIGLGVKKAADAAGMAQGAYNKFNTVFADNEEQMQSWLDTMRSDMPAARNEIARMTAGVGDLLKPMGIAEDEAANMSKQSVELADKIAAFNDVNPKEVLEAMKSGFTGMSRPLKKFGIDARKGSLQAKALEEGLLEQGQTFEDLEKNTRNQVRAQALMIQMQEQSKDAIEGYAENQDSYIRKKQEMAATAKDFAAQLGMAFLPMLEKLMQKISPVIDKFSKWVEENPKLTRNIIIAAGAISGLIAVIGGIGLVLPAIITGVSALGTVLGALASPIGLVVALFAGLVYAGWKVYQNWDEIKESLIAIWGLIAARAKTKWNKIKLFFINLWDSIKTIFKRTWQWIKNMFLNYTAQGLVIKHWDKIAKFFKNLWKKVKSLFRGALDKLKSRLKRSKEFWMGVWGTMKQKVIDVWDGIKQKIKDVINWFEKQWERIKGPVNKMQNVGSDIGRKFMSGVSYVNPFDDVLVKSDGQVVPISSNDNVLAFKGNGIGGGQVTVNVNAPVYGMDEEDVATQLGDKIIQQLNLSRKL